MATAQITTSDPLRDGVRSLASAWMSEYSLHSADWWWHFEPFVDRPFRRQGWKLHVSASPSSAVRVMGLVGEIVMPTGLRWKVARSIGQLSELCSPPTPFTQVGKFITIYLEDRDSLPWLAAELDSVTRFYDGPVVPTDQRYRRGSNVYLRYGAFESNVSYTGIDQVRQDMLVDPDGGRTEDQRAPGRVHPAWIAESPIAVEPPAVREGTGLFGRDIQVQQVLVQSAKGGVYRAGLHDRQVVVKEARIGTCQDLLGRDSRDRLVNEWRILQRLKGSGLAPEPVKLFFEENNAYLVEEFLPGATLRSTVENANYLASPTRNELLTLWRRLPGLVAEVEAHGVLLRDLTPNNIMVDGDRCTLIDLELSELIGSVEPAFSGWTPGYARKEARGRSSGDTVESALAAIAFFVLTGIDPYLGESVRISPRVDAILTTFAGELGEAAAAEFERIRAGIATMETAQSPTPASQPAFLPGSSTSDRVGADADVSKRGPDSRDLADRVLSDAVAAGEGVLRRFAGERRWWPWPEAWAPGLLHPASFASGTLGLVRYYLDLWYASNDRQWIRHADDLLSWTFDNFPFIDGQTPPGLHMGLGAMPWLMAELSIVSDGRRASLWQQRSAVLCAELAAADLRSYDITHGCAGITLTQLAVLRLLGDQTCRISAIGLTETLVNSADRSGTLPAWKPGLRMFYGFAHGSAGIAYALLEAGTILRNRSATELAIEVGHGLLELGVETVGGRGLTWPNGPEPAAADASGPAQGTPPWTHWCNGAAGVGIALLALWTFTGDETFLDGAVRAGRTITLGHPFGSCCRCHGLAGDGDFLLELATESRYHEEFRAGADRIARKLEALQVVERGVPMWPHEGDGKPRPGFMRGFAGIHSFRLRLAGLIDSSPLMLPPSIPRRP